MIGVDTNVVVRYLVEDDDEQAGRAEALFRRAIAKDETIFLSDVVLCEIVWVLQSVYRVRRGEVADLLENLMRAKQIELDDAELAHRALGAFRAGKGDFADYIIRGRALAAGCTSLATFEKQLWAEPGFAKI